MVGVGGWIPVWWNGRSAVLDQVDILTAQERNNLQSTAVATTMNFLKANRGPLIIGVLLIATWFFLRTPTTPLASVEELDALLSRSEPVVLEFFANT